MANMTNKSNEKKVEKKGPQKPSFFERMKETFRGVRHELKRVVWPNKKTMKESSTAVFSITIVVAIILFLTDSLMLVILDAAGFNRVPMANEVPAQVQEFEPVDDAELIEDDDTEIDTADEESDDALPTDSDSEANEDSDADGAE